MTLAEYLCGLEQRDPSLFVEGLRPFLLLIHTVLNEAPPEVVDEFVATVEVAILRRRHGRLN